MIEDVMVLIHGFVVLMFGVILSASFADFESSEKKRFPIILFCVFLAALQGAIWIFVNETIVWKIYPLITHLPLALFIVFFLKKRFITAVVSVFTAYLLCQPAKWFGVLSYYISNSKSVEYSVRIVVLIVVLIVSLKYLASTFSEIFEKEIKILCIFAAVPAIYYLFDYITVVYTGVWLENNRIVAEFLPFFICIIFTVFSIVYHREHERKAEAERKEHIIRITVEEQAKELEAIKRGENEMRMLRHDLRLFLSALAVCVDTDDKATAKSIINSHIEQIERTKTKRFCSNDTVNYVLSDFAAKCEAHEVKFAHTIGIENVIANEIMFSSILSNALDNALNAVSELPTEQRAVSVMIRTTAGKLLLSVKNPIGKQPVFEDGLPVTSKEGEGHGYGTQSIRYLTEKLGGNCQFTVHDEYFITRVII